MAERKQLDWEKIEAEYLAGTLTIREIAKNAGCDPALIVRKAKKYGWQRNLAERVRLETEKRLVNLSVNTVDAREVIDAATTQRVALVTQHREFLTRLTNAANQGIEYLEREKIDGPGMEPRDFAAMLRETVNAASRLIPLQRQAFNLDEKDRGGGANAKPDHDLTKLSNEQLDALAEIADTVKPT